MSDHRRTEAEVSAAAGRNLPAVFKGRTADDTVWTLVERRARLAGETALITFVDGDRPDETTTWAAVADRAVALAGRLAGLGVRPGERVALFGLNSLEYLVALFGVARLGAVCVPLNALLTAPEIAWQLADAGAVAVLGEAGRRRPARRGRRPVRVLPGGPGWPARGEAARLAGRSTGGGPPARPSRRRPGPTTCSRSSTPRARPDTPRA